MTTELLAGLTTRERALLPVLLAACMEMDDIFWQEASGDRNTVLSTIDDQDIRSLVDFNYGPWDRRQRKRATRSRRRPEARGGLASIRPTWT